MLSLSLFFVLKTREASPSHFSLPELRELIDHASSEAHIRRSVLQSSAQSGSSAAFDVIADDLVFLGELLHGSESRIFEAKQIIEFFERDFALIRSTRTRSVEKLDLRCVIFDLDEGLINSESLLFRVTREMIDEFSTASESAFSHDDYASFVGMSEREFFAREIIPRFQFSLTDPDELITIRENRYLDLLSKTDRESLCKPGFRATLSLLRRCGVRLALYSNASRRRVDDTLNHIELRNYFDIVVSSSDDGMEDKPSPQMLRYVFAQLAVQPQHCLVVESSKIGIEAAKAAGCACVGMENNYYPRRQTTIRRSGIEFLGNGWQLLELVRTLIRGGENVGDIARMSGVERNEWLKDVFDARFP